MRTEKIWRELAKYYDIIFSWKDYKKESDKIHKLIQKYKKTPGNELLEVACGTGNYIQYLKKHYKITGSDLSEDMIKIAKNKFPKIKFIKANMISLNLKKKFDVIICMFSSINYAKTHNDLRKTIGSFSKHLKSGGVLIIDPFVDSKTYHEGKIFSSPSVNKPEIKISRMNITKKRKNIAILDFHSLIGAKKEIIHFRDIHELGLFSSTKFLKIMEDNNFKVKFLKNWFMQRTRLFIGIKK